MRTIGVSDSSRNVIETVDNSSLNLLTSLAFLLFDARVVRATLCSSVHGPPRMYETKCISIITNAKMTVTICIQTLQVVPVVSILHFCSINSSGFLVEHRSFDRPAQNI